MTNKNEWIDNLIADYKKDLNEKSYNSLSDDYVKFIRYGQHFIEKNGSGVLAYISNNSFIDGIVFRQMRKNLLECFDKIYILDLHGNAKKNEISPDGSVDQNVFDIMQGVSVNIFVKTGNKKKNELGQIFNSNLFGKRNFKYEYLNGNNLKSLNWKKLNSAEPNYYFVEKDFEGQVEYEKGFQVDDIFNIKSLGIEFGSKEFLLSTKKNVLRKFITETILNNEVSDAEINIRYKIKTTSGWRFSKIRASEIKLGFNEDKIKRCLVTPFDSGYTYHSELLRRGQLENLLHLYSNNLSLLTLRQSRTSTGNNFFLTDRIYSKDVVSMLDRATGFPLYTYPETNRQQTIDQSTERTPNLNPKIVKQIADRLGLTFTNEKEHTANTFAPIDILDYIYAVLHSPTYREKYKEFLKIDFPRVPYPKDLQGFRNLTGLGAELRQIHLLEAAVVENYITSYPKDGSNQITTKIAQKDWELFDPEKQLGRIWINEEQYFDNIPLVAWEFYIGGYQPAQKWLKDRRERQLEFDDILHYQKIIVALTETDRLMKEIDKIEIE